MSDIITIEDTYLSIANLKKPSLDIQIIEERPDEESDTAHNSV